MTNPKRNRTEPVQYVQSVKDSIKPIQEGGWDWAVNGTWTALEMFSRPLVQYACNKWNIVEPAQVIEVLIKQHDQYEVIYQVALDEQKYPGEQLYIHVQPMPDAEQNLIKIELFQTCDNDKQGEFVNQIVIEATGTWLDLGDIVELS